MNSTVKVVFAVIYLSIIVGMLIPTALSAWPREASRENHLGYSSRCSFVPWSTLSMIGITGLLIGIAYGVQVIVSH